MDLILKGPLGASKQKLKNPDIKSVKNNNLKSMVNNSVLTLRPKSAYLNFATAKDINKKGKTITLKEGPVRYSIVLTERGEERLAKWLDKNDVPYLRSRKAKGKSRSRRRSRKAKSKSRSRRKSRRRSRKAKSKSRSRRRSRKAKSKSRSRRRSRKAKSKSRSRRKSRRRSRKAKSKSRSRRKSRRRSRKAKSKSRSRRKSRRRSAPRRSKKRAIPGKGCEMARQYTKKYSTRPGPPYPANIPKCKGKIMVGNDGREYESKMSKNGVYRWVRA
jgi:hypothetical protein